MVVYQRAFVGVVELHVQRVLRTRVLRGRSGGGSDGCCSVKRYSFRCQVGRCCGRGGKRRWGGGTGRKKKAGGRKQKEKDRTRDAESRRQKAGGHGAYFTLIGDSPAWTTRPSDGISASHAPWSIHAPRVWDIFQFRSTPARRRDPHRDTRSALLRGASQNRPCSGTKSMRTLFAHIIRLCYTFVYHQGD